MMLLVQPYGLHSAGGSSRILRALLENAPVRFMSISSGVGKPPRTTICTELHVPMRMSFGRLETTRFHRFLTATQPLFEKTFKRRFTEICREHQVDAIHCIAQQIDFVYAFDVARELGIPYFLTVHDHIEYLRTDFTRTRILQAMPAVWKGATARFAISKELGDEYNQRFSKAPFDIVTDHVVHLLPLKTWSGDRLNVYFMGQIHLDYKQNFESLVSALHLYKQAHPDTDVSLTIRGIDRYPLPESSVKIRLLPWATEAEVAQDMDEVDFVYMPLPFGQKHELFCKFSLSTKMVSYLGAGVPILYHGPAHSAALNLLQLHDAAIAMLSLDPAEMQRALTERMPDSTNIAANARKLALTPAFQNGGSPQFWQKIKIAEQSEKPG